MAEEIDRTTNGMEYYIIINGKYRVESRRAGH